MLAVASITTTDSTARAAPNHPPRDRTTGRAKAAASKANSSRRSSSKPRSSTRAWRFIRAAAIFKYLSDGKLHRRLPPFPPQVQPQRHRQGGGKG